MVRRTPLKDAAGLSAFFGHSSMLFGEDTTTDVRATAGHTLRKALEKVCQPRIGGALNLKQHDPDHWFHGDT